MLSRRRWDDVAPAPFVLGGLLVSFRVLSMILRFTGATGKTQTQLIIFTAVITGALLLGMALLSR